MRKEFLLIFIFLFMYKILYAPPLQRGGMICKTTYQFMQINHQQIEKKYYFDLALTANMGNNEINFNGKDFMIKLLNKCKSFPYLFIESAATIIDLEYESR